MKKFALIVVFLAILGAVAYFMFANNSGDVVGDSQSEMKTTGYEGEAGGNPDKEVDQSKMKVVSITVSYDQYWGEEEDFTLEEIVEKLNKIEGDFYVKVGDSEATHKAYSSLISKLQEMEITYEEVSK